MDGSGKEREEDWVIKEAGELLVPPHPARSAGGWTGGDDGGGVGEGERDGVGDSRGRGGASGPSSCLVCSLAAWWVQGRR